MPYSPYPRIHAGLYYYKASKTALNMVMRSIAMDTATDGIAVTVLSPGVIDTAGRMGDPELISPEMRGSIVDIDTSIGGMIKVLDTLTPELGTLVPVFRRGDRVVGERLLLCHAQQSGIDGHDDRAE